MSKPVYIYSLSHPVNKQIRYVGKATNVKLRLQSHIDYARSKNKQRPVSDWINSLLKKGLKPIIGIIEQTNSANWVEREMFWISNYRSMYDNLLNLTDGGESNTDYKYSEELKSIRRQARIGYKTPDSVRKSIAKTLSKKILCNDGCVFDSMNDAIADSGIPKSTFHRRLHKNELINGKLYNIVCNG